MRPDNRCFLDRPPLIIMTKAPVAGRSKTRLAPRLGMRGAARIQQQLIRLRLQQTQALDVPIELHVAPDLRHPVFLAARRLGFTLRRQLAGDLGTRMRRAQGSRASVIIGTDCPALDASILRQVVDALSDGNNVCIPASDGGYVLLAHARLPEPRAFRQIQWGSSEVLRQSRRQHRRANVTLQEWPALPDLDTPRDFWRERRQRRLKAFGPHPLQS